ncbi:PaaI family thioesterase [Paeniglutamicibacter cryotolerans]|uniref:Uncharacterized protein (TIGR00369 family) n=1 Tax=Paeniglutamicibacter cryotolerans TaxID=670079 RepID=A0A839QI38_9MICC|nr:PaaI family thioesterase [Paeniglutamicibacter cryotolerans]MBB2994185.1 uncharacterized protein (TIGR00369 family) [Paeniglutamicibacter cryotolerans]
MEPRCEPPSLDATSRLLREEVQGRDGLDFLRAMLAGELPISPLLDALGIALVSAERGGAGVAATPLPIHFNAKGTGHGGFISTLLDAALGFAVESMSDAGTMWTTTDLQVRFLRPMTASSGLVTATGTVGHYGRATATASGEVRDAGGRILATATAGLFALRNGA